ncbi:MAG: 30S ribosomal protein S12 methylthiotransferase RimO [Gemmatimonadaceae bacterium]|nr:30S ribosomal protein S12 methylthiotransferase RimO [Gemmatimonadaceae bacterium]
MKFSVVTLGCDKNTVDSERYVAELQAHGGAIAPRLDEAELIVVNTCGFIDAAKKESLDAILEAAQYKGDGACRTVVAVGCMVERHKAEMQQALPEVDLFLGASETDRLVAELHARGLVGDPETLHPGVRLYTGDTPWVRYLKLSEGCDHGCAFCAIPLMRGRHRSFALEDIVREAQLLELQGAREINLVAQDLAHYGRDRRDGVRLPEVLQALVRETSIPWIRNMYLYSAGITPALLDVIANEPRIVRYLDMPIQHASDAVLERMRRPERQRTIREKVRHFRDAVPGVAIRTTCIVGFPGETEADVEQLLAFLEEIEFERVGVFAYSPQEGTRAAQMEDDVPEALKRERLERVQELQRHITAARYESRIGARARVLVQESADGAHPASGRLPWQADDIDGVTWLDRDVPAGRFAEVEVLEVVDDYDFRARVVSVDAAVAARAAAPRALPVMPSSVGSFGR